MYFFSHRCYRLSITIIFSLSHFSISQSRLIVAQMSDTRCDNWNSQLTVYLLAVLVCIFPFQQCGLPQLPLDVELWILWALVGIFSLLHFHYGFGIVTEMCQHFGIKCFTVKDFCYYYMFVCLSPHITRINFYLILD